MTADGARGLLPARCPASQLTTIADGCYAMLQPISARPQPASPVPSAPTTERGPKPGHAKRPRTARPYRRPKPEVSNLYGLPEDCLHPAHKQIDKLYQDMQVCCSSLSMVCTVLVTFSVLLMDASSSSSCLSDTSAPLAGKWGLTPTPMTPYLLLHPELHVQDQCSSDIELVQASSCRAVAFGCQLRCLVCRTCWLCRGQRSRLKKMVSPRSCRCVCGPGLALLATAVSVLHSPRMAYVLHQRSTWLVSLSREALRTIAAASSNLCKHTLVLHAHISAKHYLCRFSMIRTTHMTGSTQCTTALPLTQHAWPQLSAQGVE